MKTSAIRKLLVFAILTMSSRTIAAPPLLDQSNLIVSGSARLLTTRPLAQTFRPAHSGILDSIRIGSFLANPSTPFLVEISIVDTVGGKPGDSTLGSVSMDWPNSSGLVPISFVGQNIQLQAGLDYAIVLRSDDDLSPFITYGDEVRVSWYDNPYARGSLWKYDFGDEAWEHATFLNIDPPESADLGFQTFMIIIPEPNTALLLSLGAMGLAFIRRWPRQR